MDKFKHQFKGKKGFMLLHDFVAFVIDYIIREVKNVLEQRLLLYILRDIYEKKIAPKVKGYRKSYKITLNDAQAVALAVALNNYRHQQLEAYEEVMLEGILTEIKDYLQVQQQREQNYYLTE